MQVPENSAEEIDGTWELTRYLGYGIRGARSTGSAAGKGSPLPPNSQVSPMRPAALRPFAAVPLVLSLLVSACSESPTADAHLTLDQALAELSTGLRAASPGIEAAGGFSES